MEGRWIGEGGLWKEKAWALQLRIRDRFRVAVDRHNKWPGLSDDSHYLPTLQHWIPRVRSLFRDASSPPPSPSLKFYHKRVGMNVDAVDDSIITRLLQALAVPVIGNACHVFMHGLNRIQIYGAEKLHQALLQRPEGKPLITVSNHVASVDDPFVIASLLPPSIMLDARNLRWTMCATDRCFSNPMLSAFFHCVKVLPVSRGDGVYQKGMDMALSKLNNGGWVHIFPEGSRSRDGGRTIGAAKRGVGRLVMDADNVPVVVPFVHTGMQEIMPIGTHFPKIGKRVTVLVGDPINFEDLLLTQDDVHDSRGTLYDAVSSRIGHRLQELKAQVDKLALDHIPPKIEDSYDHASRIWQQIDWEAFGMESCTSTYSSKEDYPTTEPSSVSDDPKLFTVRPRQPRYARPSVKVVGFSYEGAGIVSRIRSYMNPSELMGFAARGLFVNSGTLKQSHTNIQVVRRLKAWKQHLESNVFQQCWNGI